MREINTSIHIDASAATVWSILMDFKSYPEWNPFVVEISGESKLNSQLSIRLEQPESKAMKFKPRVIKIEPKKEFRWLGKMVAPGIFDGEHIFEIEELGADSVKFIQRERFKGILVPVFWKQLNSKTRASFKAMNIALKKRAESS